MKLHANLDKKQHKKQEYVQRKEKVHTKRNVDSEYRILGKKGEGTFSEVLKCQHVKDGTYYACKKMKQHYDGVEQVNNLREIQAMRRLNPHANIIGLHEIIYDKKTGTVALICELMDMNIYEMIRGRRHYLPEGKIKNYMYQLLKSLDHMHRCGIFHRDVKPENILIKDDVLKLADFGSCRSVYSKPPYTEYISTRWYRAPECLLTDGYYSYRMDLWSVGCVFFEVMSLHPLFPGSNEVDQIAKIHDVLGTPDSSVLNKMKHRNRGINFDFPPKKGTGIEKLIPHASSQCIELIYKMCTYDPEERITAKQALRHSYFRDLREADKKQAEAHRQLTEGSSTASVATAANTTATGTETSSWRQNQIQKKRIRILPPSVDSAVELEVDIEPTEFEGERVVIDELLAYSIPQLPPLFETPPKTVMHNAIVQKQQPVIEKSCKGGENNNSVKVKRKFSSSFPAIYDEKSATAFHMLSNTVSTKQPSLPESKPTCRKKRSKHSTHINEETSSLKIITKETSNYNGESSSLKFKKEKTNYNGESSSLKFKKEKTNYNGGESSSLKIKSKENLKTTKRRKSLVTDFKMSPGDKLKGQSKKDQTKPVNQKIVALSGNEDKTIHGTALRVSDIKKSRLKKGIVETKFDNSKGFQGFPTHDWLHNSKPVQYETFERLNENDVDYVENKVATLPQPQNSPMLPELIVSNQADRKRTAPNILNMTYIVRKPVQTPYEAHFKAMSIIPEKLRAREGHPVKKQQQLLKVDTPTRIKQESRFPEIQQRRQRRLVEQQQKSNFSVKAGNNTEGLVKAPLPHLLGAGSTYGGAGPKSVYSTTLPKVHLPRHQFAHHQTSSNLLPGILKTNVLQPKTLHKSKLKKEPKSIYGHNHYQLPTINRHVYHH